MNDTYDPERVVPTTIHAVANRGGVPQDVLAESVAPLDTDWEMEIFKHGVEIGRQLERLDADLDDVV